MVILVVDDNAVVSESVTDYLRECGHQVFQAPDGVHAIEIASRIAASLQAVVTDIEMPGLDGITMWKRMVPMVSPSCRVLFMTGGKTTLDRGSIPGELLLKPFSLPDLKRRLASLDP